MEASARLAGCLMVEAKTPAEDPIDEKIYAADALQAFGWTASRLLRLGETS